MKQILKYTYTIIVVLIILLSQQHLSAEVVFLKNGNIIKCKIDKDTYKYLYITTKDGKKKKIVRKNVLRIYYRDLYLGKVFIKKRNGKGLEAYLINENMTSYTFRWKINSTNEFTIKRADIIFIVRSEPSALRARYEKNTITLSWSSPYNKIAWYNIYYKTKGEKNYNLIAKSKQTTHTLKNLLKKLEYNIIVKAVNFDGAESNPSNMITVSHSYTMPVPPKGIQCKTEFYNNSKNARALLSWQASKEKDLTYRIFRITDHGHVVAGETKNSSYTISNLTPEVIHRFVIRGINKQDHESKDSSTVFTRTRPSFSITANAFGLIPLDFMNDMYAMGTGMLTSFHVNHLVFNNTLLGIDLGATYLFSKEDMFQYALIAPFFITEGYTISLSRLSGITLKISQGICFKQVVYDKEYNLQDKSKAEFKAYRSISPAFMGTVQYNYMINQTMNFQAGAGYMTIIERKLLHFLQLQIGVQFYL